MPQTTRGSDYTYADRHSEKPARRPQSRQPGKRGLMVVAAVLVIAGLISGILISKVLVVRNINVIGLDEATANEVIQQSGIEQGQSIFAVDERQVRLNLQRLGQISLNDFKRLLPDTIQLEVSERTVCAGIMHLGFMLLLDEDCYVVDSLNGYADLNLLMITGAAIRQTAAGEQLSMHYPEQHDAICTMIAELQAADMMSMISELNVADLSNIYLVSRAGVQAKLGDISSMPDKLRLMKAALSEIAMRGISGGKLNVINGKFVDYSPPEIVETPQPTESVYPSTIDRLQAEEQARQGGLPAADPNAG